ncbi:hypothetical protein KJZ71_03910 [Patescibacteria group bacterium]|nr:hypothetical protein [Patescibacteria group bacterium]
MSDLGLLSKQYEQLNVLLRRLRKWITVSKQVYYELGDGVDEIDKTEAVASLTNVVIFLEQVIPAEDEGEWAEEWIIDPPLPIEVVKKIREAHANNQPLFLDRLRRLTLHLKEDLMQLTDTDIEMLDEIMLAASADVNEVFRRMMRWV